MSSPSAQLPVPPPQPAPPSYRLAAADALRRGDRDVYRLLSSQPGVGANPLIPTVAEVKDSMDVYGPIQRWGQPVRKRWRTCLDMCAREGHTQALEAMLGGMSAEEKETELDVEDEDGATALWYAASYGHTAIVRILCETGCVEVDKVRHHEDGTERDSTPLMAATRRGGHADTLSVLLSFGADMNFRRRHRCDRSDDSSVLEMLCSSYPSPSIEAVRVLLEAGADPNSHRTMWRGLQDDASVLMQSVEHPGVVALLIKYGADVNYRLSQRLGRRDDRPVLHEACALGDPSSVRLLCEAGADVHAITTYQNGGRQRSSLGYIAALAFESLGPMTALLSTGRAGPFAVDPPSRRPLIEVAAGFPNPSLVVLMDSRPYVE